jgi:hypothetical protein
MNSQIKFTPHQKRLLPLIFVLLAIVLLLGLVQTTAAQIVRTRPTPPVKTTVQKKTVVFKGMGVSQKRPLTAQLNLQKTPRSLSAAEKTAALKEAMSANGIAVKDTNFTARPYAVLSAQTPYVADRGYLIYWGLLTANSSRPGISFIKGGYDGLEIFIKPDRAGRWFMLDCKVSASGSVPLRVTGPDGNTTEFANFADGHLLTFMVSQNTEWQQFYIQRNDAWGLDSCEVTTTN